MKKKLAIYRNDPWLEPYADAIEGRHEDVVRKEAELTTHCNSLKDFANAHQYFGLHRQGDWWVFREWAPNATQIFLVGDFSGWEEKSEFFAEKARQRGVGNPRAVRPHTPWAALQDERALARRPGAEDSCLCHPRCAG